MESSSKYIPPAEIIRNGIHFEGIAQDYTVLPKKDNLENFAETLGLITFSIIGILLSLILYPLFAVVFVVVVILPGTFAIFFVYIIKCGKIKILLGEKSFWAAGQDVHIFVQVVQGDGDMNKIHQHFSDLIAKDANLKEVILQKCGYFCSHQVDTIHIHDHVKYYNAKSKNFPIKEEEIIFDLEHSLLPETDFTTTKGPKWDVLFIPKFLSSDSKCDGRNQYALIFRFSNSRLGLSELFNYICRNISEKSAILDDADTQILDIKKNTGLRKLAIYVTAIIFGPTFLCLSLFRSVNKLIVDTSESESASVGGTNIITNYFSKTEQFNLKALNVLKEQTFTSLVAILVSSVGSSIRNLVLGLNCNCPDQLLCSYHSNYSEFNGKCDITAKFAIGIGLDQPIKRLHSVLHKINSELQILIAAEDLANHFFIKIMGCFPAFVVKRTYNRFHRTNVNIQHLVGPSESLKFGGDDVIDIYAWSMKSKEAKDISATIAELRVSVISYCGNIRACYNGTSTTFNSSHLQSLKMEFEDEIFKISELCGLSRKRLQSQSTTSIHIWETIASHSSAS